MYVVAYQWLALLTASVLLSTGISFFSSESPESYCS
jgi:hypothetical protein